VNTLYHDSGFVPVISAVCRSKMAKF